MTDFVLANLSSFVPRYQATGLEGERIEKAFVTVSSDDSLRKRSSLSSSASKNGLNEVFHKIF